MPVLTPVSALFVCALLVLLSALLLTTITKMAASEVSFAFIATIALSGVIGILTSFIGFMNTLPLLAWGI
jgi:uncharacterized membrane protein